MNEKNSIISTEDFPLVTIKLNNDIETEDQLEAFLEELSDFYASNKQIVVIYYLGALKSMPSKVRIQLGHWIKENNELVKSSVLGTCYVIPNIISRLMINSIFLVQKPSWNHKVTPNEEEAIKWAKTILEANRNA